MRYFYIIFLSIILLSSCVSNDDNTRYATDGTAYPIKYAHGFSIFTHDNYTEVHVLNPWDTTKTAVTYYLTHSDSVKTPDDGIRIHTPLKTVATSSVTQYEFLSLLGEIQSIKGICSPELTYNPTIDSLYKVNEITSLGDAFNINNERLITLAPDALIATFYNQNSLSDVLNNTTGIPVIYDNEWTENTLLARAEWIKFIAAFYDKLPLADSIFNDIDSSYNATLRTLKSVKNQRSVMVGNNFRGVWYMPGGNSYMGNLLRDAHASYFYLNDTTSASLSLNFETVLANFSDCDVWLNAPCNTLHELTQMDERHSLFRPVRTGEVFSFRRRTNASGAIDYWESGVAHPDIILQDVVWALYPDLLPDHKPFYIHKLTR